MSPALRLALSTGAALLTMAAPAGAQLPELPRIGSAAFDAPPVAGAPAPLRVEGQDRPGVGPVSGVDVDFGDEAIGGSACALGADGVALAPAARSSYSFSVAHAFATAAPQTVAVTMRWGGCGEPAATDTRTLDVTPAPAASGAPPAPPATDGSLFPDLLGDVVELGDLVLTRRSAVAVAAARCRGADVVPKRGNLRRSVRTTACLLNSVRRANGMRSLRFSVRLRRAARYHNLDMNRRRYFAHQSSPGPDLGRRLRRARYVPYRLAGENLGGGTGRFIKPRNMVRSWMASPGHRENVLRPQFREIGVSIVRGWAPRGPRSGATYTADYGLRR